MTSPLTAFILMGGYRAFLNKLRHFQMITTRLEGIDFCSNFLWRNTTVTARISNSIVAESDEGRRRGEMMTTSAHDIYTFCCCFRLCNRTMGFVHRIVHCFRDNSFLTKSSIIFLISKEDHWIFATKPS